MGFQVQVEILFAEGGAREAARREAVTIVVDALRASATTATALSLGAREVVPVLTVEEAATYVGRPQHRVAGERQGAKCEGFDHGNSPTEMRAEQARFVGQTLVLSTSNGTKMVEAARRGATAVFMGTTLNARAVAQAAWLLANEQGRDIVLVAAGEYGEHAEEDDCAARCIAAHLHDLGAACPPEILRDESTSTVFQATPSADELRSLGYEADIEFCAQRDIFDIAPILHGNGFVPFQAEMVRAVA
jgi:2-phosphosulfolactate phosphatase